MGIKITQKGDFSKVEMFLERLKEGINKSIFDKYGKMGVEALRNATPVDTGLTAASWSYQVIYNGDGVTIEFHNSNINKHVNIALILQYGHGTGTGGWVEGRDYINPAIQPIFDQMAEEAWREVVK
jgi:hypothetical protein